MDFSPEVSFFALNFSCFGRYSGKKLVKMGSENGKMLQTETEVDFFQPEVTKIHRK